MEATSILVIILILAVGGLVVYYSPRRLPNAITGYIVYATLPPINGVSPTTKFYTVDLYYLVQNGSYIMFGTLEGFYEGNEVNVTGNIEERSCDGGTFRVIIMTSISHS
jgi:hypothetical protein